MIAFIKQLLGIRSKQHITYVELRTVEVDHEEYVYEVSLRRGRTRLKALPAFPDEAKAMNAALDLADQHDCRVHRVGKSWQ